MKKTLQLLAVILIALSVASCGGGGAKVKKAITVEDCIKIPKQSVAIKVVEDDGDCNLTAIIKLENIKKVDESEFVSYPAIIINLLDKDGVELIRLGSSIRNDLLTTEGKKIATEFSLMWGNEPSKERLEEIKKQTKTIVLADSQIINE